MTEDVLRFFAEPGPMSLTSSHADALRHAPTDLAQLAGWIQGLMIHQHLASHYGQELTPERQAHSQHRFVDDVLGGIQSYSAAPFDEARAADQRSIGVCSHFSLLAVSVLRAHGIPARARCGFATYFEPTRGVDHWLVETWTGERWRRADFQIDDRQRRLFKLAFDALDQPAGRFLEAGAAWQQCRRGDADPQSFGIFDQRGYWFIAGDLVRDLASLNKVEMLPWDVWGAMPKPAAEMTEADLERFDRLAELTVDPDRHFAALQQAYQSPDWRMNGAVFNASRKKQELVVRGL